LTASLARETKTVVASECCIDSLERAWTELQEQVNAPTIRDNIWHASSEEWWIEFPHRTGLLNF
jgi:hypothetical protein